MPAATARCDVDTVGPRATGRPVRQPSHGTRAVDAPSPLTSPRVPAKYMQMHLVAVVRTARFLRPQRGRAMIDLYYWTTPNGHKITMFLEEAGLPYKIIPINIGKGDQFKPEFLAIAPEQPDAGDRRSRAERRRRTDLDVRIRRDPALSRRQDRASSCRTSSTRRNDVLQWLFWQMGGLGPMAGQNHHFNNYAPEKIPYAINRYVNETNRLYGVLNKRLADREFVAGEYSIADMASYPWIVPLQEPEPEHRRLPASQALVRGDRAAPGDGARLRQGQGDQPRFRPARDPHRGREEAACSARPRRWCAESA